MKNLILLHFIILFSCHTKSKNLDATCGKILHKTYSDEIFEIKKKVVDLTYLREPLTYKVYQPLYDNPECFINDAYKFIKANSDDPIAIGIVLLSLHKLNSLSTIKFTKKIYPIVSEDVFIMWIIGAHGNESFINYDTKTESYLKKLQRDKKLSENSRAIIGDLLAGKIDGYD